MRAHILGTGLVLGLAVTAFGSPVAWAEAGGISPSGYAASMDGAGHALGVTFTVIEPEDPTHDLPADYITINPMAARPGDRVAAQGSCAETDEATLSSPVLQTVTAAPSDDGGQTDADDGQVSRVPKGAPETGDGARGVSVPMLALGLVLGATAGAGAIAWREARR